MCNRVTQPKPWTHNTSARTLKKIMISGGAIETLVALFTVIIFFKITHVESFIVNELWGTNSAPVLWAATVLAAVMFSRVNYSSSHHVFKLLMRITAIGVLAYLVFERPVFTLVYPKFLLAHQFIDYGYWLAIVCAIFAVFRPSFLYPAAYYVILSRHVVDDISGFSMSVLDIRYIMEMAQYLSICACFIATLYWAQRSSKAYLKSFLEKIDLNKLSLCIAFVAIGMHLGNYFWSGVAKLQIGSTPFDWVLYNEGHNMILGALYRGIQPFGGWPNVIEVLLLGFGSVILLSNIFTLGFQLAAVAAPIRIKYLKIISVIYDIFHIGIYLIGGLFFWPWIWNNIAVLLAIRNVNDNEIGKAPKLCCILMIFFGGFESLGNSARLAWFDVVDFKYPKIEARLQNEDIWRIVPASYFMSHSYSVSHGYFDNARTPNHYPPTRTSAWKFSRSQTSGTCPEPNAVINPESPEARSNRLNRVKQFLRAHHTSMLNRAGDDGWFNFYLRSHHQPSNPLLYENFNSIDIRKIVQYRLVSKSVCLTWEEKELKQRVVAEEIFNIDV